VKGLDAALAEVAPKAHVLLASAAIRTRIRTANARDDRRAGPERAGVARHASEALMTQDQHVGAVGCLPVLAALDLGVGPTQPDAHDIDEHIALGEGWLGYIADCAGARATRNDRERTHSRSI